MALEVGSRLGHYDVTALIGEGGMGQVWQATDTQLGRDVALKVLPEAFTSDPDRLARFEREAKVLASLNHPNIGSIYGLEEAEGVKALVLELVEGPTLADRIKQGAIPIDDALPIAKQIADALEAAHEQGVIHRDLKPANVKVKDDGTVKVLDFGLAKAFQPEASGPSTSMSPTISLTAAATQMGMVIGTAAYMSPEQAKGKAVDKRADVWAFGAVLFEMLTGRKLFEAGDVSETLASVLLKDPDVSGMGSNVPLGIRTLLRRCLVKDPNERMRDIGEARIGLREAARAPVVEPVATSERPDSVRRGSWWPLVVTAVAAALIAGTAVWFLTVPDAAVRGIARFHIEMPSAEAFAADPFGTIAITPDGGRAVFRATLDGLPHLYVRSLDDLDAVPLRGLGDDPRNPFISPDGEWVGYFTNTELRKVSILGGPPLTVCVLPSPGPRGATWGPDDTIVFATVGTGLLQVSTGGGEPEPLTTPDTSRGALNHGWPEFLPGGDSVLFTIFGIENPQISVLSLQDGTQTTLVPGGTDPHFTMSGHIVYGVAGTLRAVGFDLDRLEVTSNPIPVVDGVSASPTGSVQFAVSRDGSLLYLSGSGLASGLGQIPVWADHAGREEPLPGFDPGNYGNVRVSPEGTQLVGSSLDPATGSVDLWTYDLARDTLSRLTTDPAQDTNPLWTPDGRAVVFESSRDGGHGLFEISADGAGAVERLLARDGVLSIEPRSWSPDGSMLVFTESNPETGVDIGLLSMAGDESVEHLLQTEFDEGFPAVSPNGRWIAYSSDRSGGEEVSVERFPELGARQRVSTNGGRMPLWSPDGRELYYRSVNGRRVFAVAVDAESSFIADTPQLLFEGDYPAGALSEFRTYDLDADGSRFVIVKRDTAQTEAETAPELVLVQNWFEELNALVPIP